MKIIAFSQRVLRAPGSGRAYKTYGTSRRGAAAHRRTSAPRPKAAPSRRPRSLRGTRRVRLPFHLKAALIVNPLGATVVTWVTNWPRRCIHTLSLTHSPRVGP